MLPEDVTDKDDMRKQEVFIKSHIFKSMVLELWVAHIFVGASPRDKSTVMIL